jgi:hypothetical protein
MGRAGVKCGTEEEKKHAELGWGSLKENTSRVFYKMRGISWPAEEL